MNWNQKRVIIVGAARQGTALARYLVERGAAVVLTDLRSADELSAARRALDDLPVEWSLDGHPLSLLDGADLVCPSGGVPLTIPFVVAAQERGIKLSNDSQIFLEETLGTVVGITGSAGKTTTTMLVERIAKAAEGTGPYIKTYAGGNIGRPLIAKLDEIKAGDLAVMELSSFQLALITRSPQVAALLNLTPNHLDRHGTMEAYTAAKRRILDYQSGEDAAVLGRDDPSSWALAVGVKGRLYSFGFQPLEEGQLGSFLRDGQIWLRTENGEGAVMPVGLIELRGGHNLQNVLAACAIAAAAGLPNEAMRAGVVGFSGAPHRLDYVREWGGAAWYNDSKATSPQMAITAIQAFNEPLVVLVGGRDKRLPWEDFARLAAARVDHLVLFGEAAGVVGKALEAVPGSYSLDVCPGLAEAVAAAAGRISPGDVVLLAPGATSFDEFSDYEARGARFKDFVNQLA